MALAVENEQAEDGKRKSRKKKRFISWDFFAGFSQGELPRNNLTEDRGQSTGISVAVHKPHLSGFSKEDRKKPWYKRRLFRDFFRVRELGMEEFVPLYEIVLTKSQLFGKDTWNRG